MYYVPACMRYDSFTTAIPFYCNEFDKRKNCVEKYVMM